MTPTESETRVLRALQGHRPPRPDFFEALAAETGLTLEALFGILGGLKERGALKRVGAVVRHGRLGFGFNAMVAMRVPPERMETAGRALAALPFVSHCYERAVPAAFPFPLFAMVHARSEEEGAARIRQVEEAARPEAMRVLRSLREGKKESMTYL